MFTRDIIRLLNLDAEDQAVLAAITGEGKLIADVRKMLDVPRSTIAYKLSSLHERGLVSKTSSGKRIIWQAIPINKVLRKITDQRTSSVTVYRGHEEMALLWQRIADMPENTRFTTLQPPKSLKLALQKTSHKIAIDVSEKLKERKFIFDSIGHQNYAHVVANAYGNTPETKKLVQAFTERLEDMVSVPDDFIDEKAELFLFKNSVVFMDWNAEISIEIQNEAIHDLMLALFEKVKAYGNRFYLGKQIKEVAAKKKTFK